MDRLGIIRVSREQLVGRGRRAKSGGDGQSGATNSSAGDWAEAGAGPGADMTSSGRDIVGVGSGWPGDGKSTASAIGAQYTKAGPLAEASAADVTVAVARTAFRAGGALSEWGQRCRKRPEK